MLNRNVLVLIVVFLVAFTVALWFKFNDQQDSRTVVVQDDAVEVAAESDPAMTEPGVSQKATSTDVSESGLAEAERAQSTTGTASGVHEPTVVSVAAPQANAKKIPIGPEGDLAISGRVLNRAGTPVPGIKMEARATYLFDSEQGKLIYARTNQRMAVSGNDGTYAFERLADGEYHINTEATEHYSRAQISVRAGVDFVDLVLTGQRELSVNGLVSTAGGDPLTGVMVTPLGQSPLTVSSGEDGRYTFEIKLMETAQSLAVRASKQGYKDREVRLDKIQPGAGSDFELNIVMEPDADTVLAEVSGRLTDPEGEPVAAQRIGLSSAGTRQNHRVITDVDGKFIIQDVEPGDDYMLTINTVDAYADVFQKNLKISRTGLKLNIELLALETGTLSGQMVNVHGASVPGFMLVLQTKQTSYYNKRVLGDDTGDFRVEKAPAGELRLRTKSSPYYTIEGIKLAPEAEQQVAVVLDFGEDEIRGRVLNDQGYPVAVPNISLTWSHQQYGIRSTSRRAAAADEQGNFHFSQLGPGTHRLVINAAGYKPVTLNHNVSSQGTDLEVKLQPK